MMKARSAPSGASRPSAKASAHSPEAASGQSADPASQVVSKRSLRAQERRAAIVAAAFEEFVARGFAATRMEDVARRARVGKGTIYLHFKDKEALFQELVRTELVPVISRFAVSPDGVTSARDLLERFTAIFANEIAGTRRGDILRLMVAEGSRFPQLAEFYYREVVERGLAMMRQVIAYGIARGEISDPDLARFPQIVPAPALLAIVWQGLFGRFAPLDVAAMLKVHFDLIFGPRRTQ